MRIFLTLFLTAVSHSSNLSPNLIPALRLPLKATSSTCQLKHGRPLTDATAHTVDENICSPHSKCGGRQSPHQGRQRRERPRNRKVQPPLFVKRRPLVACEDGVDGVDDRTARRLAVARMPALNGSKEARAIVVGKLAQRAAQGYVERRAALQCDT
jgi:hypothetical protein